MVEGHNKNISSNDSIATPDSKSGELKNLDSFFTTSINS